MSLTKAIRYNIVSPRDPSLCLNVSGGFGKGHKAILWDNKRDPNSQFEFHGVSANFFGIKCPGTDLVLDIEGGRVGVDGTNIIAWDGFAADKTNQHFKIVPHPDGGGVAIVDAGGKCLNCSGGDKKGSEMVVWGEIAHPNNRWLLQPIGFPTPGMKFNIVSTANTSLCFNCEGGSRSGGTMILWDNFNDPNSKFSFVPLDDGTVGIKVSDAELYINVWEHRHEDGAVLRLHESPPKEDNVRFTIVPHSSGGVSFVTRRGKAFNVLTGASKNNKIGLWQGPEHPHNGFFCVPAGYPFPGAKYAIEAHEGGLYMNCEGGPKEGGSIILWDAIDANSTWEFVAASNGALGIKVPGQELYLNIWGHDGRDGAELKLHPHPPEGHANVQFNLFQHPAGGFGLQTHFGNCLNTIGGNKKMGKVGIWGEPTHPNNKWILRRVA